MATENGSTESDTDLWVNESWVVKTNIFRCKQTEQFNKKWIPRTGLSFSLYPVTEFQRVGYRVKVNSICVYC